MARHLSHSRRLEIAQRKQRRIIRPAKNPPLSRFERLIISVEPFNTWREKMTLEEVDERQEHSPFKHRLVVLLTETPTVEERKIERRNKQLLPKELLKQLEEAPPDPVAD